MRCKETVIKIAVLGMFLALGVLVSMIPPIRLFDGSLRILFTFLVTMSVGCLFEWNEAVLYGLVLDLISFSISYSSGEVFFPGYTVSSMASMLIYSISFYHIPKEITYRRVLITKLIVNVLINVLMGSLWRVILYSSEGYLYYVVISLIKNLALAPIESLLWYGLYKKVLQPYIIVNWLPKKERVS